MDALYSSSPLRPSRAWLGSLVLLPVCLYVGLGREPISWLGATSGLLDAGGQALFGLISVTGHLVGGILLQLLVPFTFFVFFARYRFCFGMQVFLVWLGHNFLHVGRYEPLGAEWPALLQVLGLGAHDYLLGGVCALLSGILFLTALVLPVFMDD